MLEKVISGGQTGADRAGLMAAKAVGLVTGGWMPKGYLAQDGYHHEFQYLYNMKEHVSRSYPPRTRLNVQEADGTLRIAANWDSAGEILTLKAIKHSKKPYFDVDSFEQLVEPQAVADWLITNDIRILNVAGNSERTFPGTQDFAYKFLLSTFAVLGYLTTRD